MTEKNGSSMRETSHLTDSIEFVVRGLVKLLVGRITLVRLQELIQISFIKESEASLRIQNPGRDVRLTNLSLMTGLDTRTLAKIRNSENYLKPTQEVTTFVRGLTPERCMIELWTSDIRFIDSKTGKPMILDIWGEESSFEIVVKEAFRSRGVTVRSALKRMEDGGYVSLIGQDKVELRSELTTSRSERQKIGAIQAGLNAAGHLLHAAKRKIDAKVFGERE